MSAPRPWVRSMPRSWWLRRPAYLRYMLREMTCVLIGAWCLWLIYGLLALGRGDVPWQAFVEALASLPGVAFQLLVLAGALYHSVTWFALAPRVMPLRIAGRRVPGAWVQLGHYLVAALIAASLVLLTSGY